MVKVLSFSLFSKQHVTNSELEPVDIAVISEETFLVATKEGSIQAYSVGEDCVLLHQFLSASQSVSKIVYVPYADCILALEKKHERSDTMVVRAYFNWRVGTANSFLRQYHEDAIEKADDFGILHHSDRAFTKKAAVRFYKFPNIISDASAIAVCPFSGNVAIASGNLVSVFIRSPDISSPSTPPFVNLVDVDTLWPATMLSLCGDCIAYSSAKELQVLRLDIRKISSRKSALVNPSGGQAEPKWFTSSKTNTVIDDTYVVECEYLPEKGAMVHSQQYMSLSLPSLNPNPKKNVDDWNEFELIGPLVISDHGVKIVQSTDEAAEDEEERDEEEEDEPPLVSSDLLSQQKTSLSGSYYLHKVVLILHKRFSGPDLIHTITFHPEFIPPDQRDARFEQHDSHIPSPEVTSSPLSLPRNKIGRTQFFVSNPLKGFLYDVMSGALLSRYCYTNDSIGASFTDSFLYIVTGSGLETWAVRNSLTEKMKNELALPEILDFPDPSLFGFHPFISLKTVIAAGNYLVLLTKHTHSDSVANLPSTFMPKLKRSDSSMGMYSGSPSMDASPMSVRYGSSPAKGSPYRVPGGRTLSITTLTSFVNSDELKIESRQLTPELVISSSVDEFRGAANWNLYVLNPISLRQLFDDIVRMAEESTNDAIKFLVLLEGYFLLQTKLVSLESWGQNEDETPEISHGDILSGLSISLNIKNIRLLFRLSSALLADFFMDIKQYDLAARFFVNSDRKLSEVISKFDISDQLPQNQDSDMKNRARALISYLNQILFTKDELEFVDETKELSNFILKNIYHPYDPSTLADVILDSCLNQYDQTLAVDLMEGLRKQRIMAQVMQAGGIQPAVSLYVRPKESFALALLYLDLGKISLAKQMTTEIEREYLAQLCVYYSSLLHPEGGADSKDLQTGKLSEGTEIPEDAVPSLGQLLKITLPAVFLEVLIRLREKNYPVPVVIDLIRFDPTSFKDISTQTDVVDNTGLFQIYMEILLSEFESVPVDISVQDLSVLVTELLALYLESMRAIAGDKIQSNKSKTPFAPMNESLVDFAQFRFPWLNQLESSNRDVSPAIGSHTGSSPPISGSLMTGLSRETSQALGAVITKVQNLLCSPFPYNAPVVLELFQQIAADIPERKHLGLWILEVLICPAAGRLEEGLAKLLLEKPDATVVVEYAKHSCQKLEHWKVFLNKLLSVRESISREGREREVRKICRESYTMLLDYLTTVFDPNVFLQLLPTNGSLSYFIPIIETSLQRYFARSLKKTTTNARVSGIGAQLRQGNELA